MNWRHKQHFCDCGKSAPLKFPFYTHTLTHTTMASQKNANPKDAQKNVLFSLWQKKKKKRIYQALIS